jgi:hypothetical protein
VDLLQERATFQTAVFARIVPRDAAQRKLRDDVRRWGRDVKFRPPVSVPWQERNARNMREINAVVPLRTMKVIQVLIGPAAPARYDSSRG